jgi:hypothetical protein
MYYPILREGLKVKNHREIIKGFGLSLLLLLLVSAVAVSENTHEITVTIVESSSSDGGDNSNTVISTYDSEGGLIETTEIFGDDSTTTGVSDSEDNGNNGDIAPAENTDLGDIPDSQPDDLVLEEYNDEWFKLILSILDDENSLVIADDFPEDINDIFNIE